MNQAVPNIGTMHLVLKTYLQGGKPTWVEVKFQDAFGRVSQIPDGEIISGHTGVWLQPLAFAAGQDKPYHWLMVDVEAPGQHGDLAANIEAAQGLYIWLQEHQLTEGLLVFLSGRGFRFVWPYLLDYDQAEGFKEWLKAMPGIDPSPNNKKNGFHRLLAYRGVSSRIKLTNIF